MEMSMKMSRRGFSVRGFSGAANSPGLVNTQTHTYRQLLTGYTIKLKAHKLQYSLTCLGVFFLKTRGGRREL